MRKILFFLVLFFIIFIFGFNHCLAANQPDIVINEVCYDPPQSGIDKNYEWLEIYNRTENDIDLTGWGILDASSSLNNLTGILSAHKFMIIASTESGFTTNFNLVDISSDAQILFLEHTIGDSSYGLANGGDCVKLKDSLGNIVDSISWGSFHDPQIPNIPIVSSGHSIERYPKGYDTNQSSNFIDQAIPTPGEGLELNQPPVANAGADRSGKVSENISFDGSSSYDPDGAIINYSWDFGDGSSDEGTSVQHIYSEPGDYVVTLQVTDDRGAYSTSSINVQTTWPVFSSNIRINEILPNPSGDEGVGEYIEIYNNSSEVVSLQNWWIEDLSGHAFKIGNLTIEPYGFLVFYRSETGITLNNDSETLSLYHPDGVLCSAVGFSESAPEDYSFNYENGGWFWSTSLTPDSANIITEPLEATKTSKSKVSKGKSTKSSKITTGLKSAKDSNKNTSIQKAGSLNNENLPIINGNHEVSNIMPKRIGEIIVWIIMISSGIMLGFLKFIT